mmetsp:Transcript_2713/g.5808  ORF Transcript_2713/g.5808 Transcript_2713/m.5808 type:complete len:94 (+) Transcript_2713:327-608(+)
MVCIPVVRTPIGTPSNSPQKESAGRGTGRARGGSVYTFGPENDYFVKPLILESWAKYGVKESFTFHGMAGFSQCNYPHELLQVQDSDSEVRSF